MILASSSLTARYRGGISGTKERESLKIDVEHPAVFVMLCWEGISATK